MRSPPVTSFMLATMISTNDNLLVFLFFLLLLLARISFYDNTGP